MIKTKIVDRWLEEIAAAKSREDDYRKEGEEVLKIYNAKLNKPFNILFSNTETLLPALYSNTPRPVVERRFKTANDNDPVTKSASLLGQRMLEYLIDTNYAGREKFSEAMEAAVIDALLPGRGVTGVMYDAEIISSPEQDSDGENYEQSYSYVEEETISIESKTWNKVIFGFATKWANVPWIAYEQYMDKAECVKKFGKKIAKKLKYTKTDTDQQHDNEDGGESYTDQESISDKKTVQIYQIWDKSTKRILYISDCYKDGYLKEEDDPYQLTGFYNCPKPLQFLKKNDIVPISLYKQYENQAEELNIITGRLNKVFAAIKVVGFFNGNLQADIEDLLSKEDLTLTPTSQTALVTDGGLDKNIWIWPIDKLINVANMLILARDQAKKVIYEITGISDILRASTNANETLGAQKIKEAWGTLKVKRYQADVANYVRDTLRIMLEMAITKMDVEKIKKISQLNLETSQSHAQAKQAIEAIKAQASQIQLQIHMAQQSPQSAPEAQQQMQQQAQQQMQKLQQQMQQAQKTLSVPAWEDVIELLRDDMHRSWKIDIETNSTVDIDATEDKKDMSDTMNAMAQFMNGIAPMMEAGLMDFEAAKAMLITVARKLRFGIDIEDRIANMQPPQKQDDGKAEKEKADIEKKIMAQQQQSAQMVAQAEKANQAAANDNEKLKLELSAMQKMRELDKRELELAKREIKVDFREMQVDHTIEMHEAKESENEIARKQQEEVFDKNLENILSKAVDKQSEITEKAAVSAMSKAPDLPVIFDRLDEITKQIQDLMEDVSSPTEFTRDGFGKVTQVKKGKRISKITRDANGKMAIIG